MCDHTCCCTHTSVHYTVVHHTALHRYIIAIGSTYCRNHQYNVNIVIASICSTRVKYKTACHLRIVLGQDLGREVENAPHILSEDVRVVRECHAEAKIRKLCDRERKIEGHPPHTHRPPSPEKEKRKENIFFKNKNGATKTVEFFGRTKAIKGGSTARTPYLRKKTKVTGQCRYCTEPVHLKSFNKRTRLYATDNR